MRFRRLCIIRLVLVALVIAPATSLAQQTHVVQVWEHSFSPSEITIQVGDTVRWENNDAHSWHDLHSMPPGIVGHVSGREWTHEQTFTKAGSVYVYCRFHRDLGMGGRVIVEGAPFEIDVGLGGNWWSGPARNGEGVQLEVSDGADGEAVFVATIYAYSPEGGQIFLIAVGTPVGDSAEVEVYITDGGFWSDALDPDLIDEISWGSGTFIASDCDSVKMTLVPNAEHEGLGYTSVSFDMVRLTTPVIPCPFEAVN